MQFRCLLAAGRAPGHEGLEGHKGIQEAAPRRVVVAVGQQDEVGLAVGIIPPLRPKAKRGGVGAAGGVALGAVGIEEVAGEDIAAAVEALAGSPGTKKGALLPVARPSAVTFVYARRFKESS